MISEKKKKSCYPDNSRTFTKNEKSKDYCKADNNLYYSTIMSFYHIRSREQAKYEAVIHCSVLV